MNEFYKHPAPLALRIDNVDSMTFYLHIPQIFRDCYNSSNNCCEDSGA